jgi:hypothetical protein
MPALELDQEATLQLPDDSDTVPRAVTGRRLALGWIAGLPRHPESVIVISIEPIGEQRIKT